MRFQIPVQFLRDNVQRMILETNPDSAVWDKVKQIARKGHTMTHAHRLVWLQMNLGCPIHVEEEFTSTVIRIEYRYFIEVDSEDEAIMLKLTHF